MSSKCKWCGGYTKYEIWCSPKCEHEGRAAGQTIASLSAKESAFDKALGKIGYYFLIYLVVGFPVAVFITWFLYPMWG